MIPPIPQPVPPILIPPPKPTPVPTIPPPTSTSVPPPAVATAAKLNENGSNRRFMLASQIL